MQIVVDDQQIDVTLERERTLSDVVAAVNEWVVAHGLAMTTLQVNGVECALDTLNEWGDRAIEVIEEVRIATQPQWQLILSHLELIVQFLRSWDSALVDNDPDSIHTLVEQQQDLARHLQEHVELIFPDLSASSLQSVFAISGNAEEMISPPEGAPELHQRLTPLIALIQQRINEIRDPRRETALTAAMISTMLSDVRDVSVLLQTGKDQQAMEHVVRFSELVEKFLRTLPHLARVSDSFRNSIDRSDDLNGITGELNTALRELVEAFDAQDSVLIGDLLEYEIAPRIEDLISVIPSGDGR